MLQRRALALGLSALPGLLVLRPAAASEQMRITVETNPNHVRNRNLELFVAQVRERLGQQLAPQVFPSAQLFRDRDVPRALRQGGVEMGLPGWWNLDGIAPDAALTSLPMFYGLRPEIVHRLIDGPAGQQINRRLEERLRVKVLGRWWDLGAQHFYTVAKPLTDFADLEGLRIRHPGGSANAARIRTIGANPVLVPWPDVPLALSQRTVDGLVTTHESAYTAKLWDAGVRHAFEDFQCFNQYIPMASQTLLRRLSDAQQRVLVEIWEGSVDRERREAAAAQAAARETLLQNGVTVRAAPPDAVAAMRQRLMGTQDQIVGEIGMDRDLVAGVLREIRAAGVAA